MKKVLLAILCIVSLLNGNFVDVTLKTDSQYTFEEYQLMNMGTGTTHLKKDIPINSIEFHGYFNDMIGAKLTKYQDKDEYTINSYETYFASRETTYFSYAKDKREVQYDNDSKIHSTRDIIKYTIYDLLVIEDGNFQQVTTQNIPFAIELTTDEITEANKSINSQLIYTGNIDKITLSTENLYKHIQEKSVNGEDFLTPVGFSKNFNSFLRVYGVFIASYEHHSISKGRIRFDHNNSTYTMGAETDADTGIVTYKAFNEEVKISNDSANAYIGESAKYKGVGLGYKMTLEAYLHDLSLFVTLYEKKTNLKAYHKDNVTKTGSISVAQKSKLTYHTQNVSFGIKYRF